MQSWDDARFFLAVCRAGSFTGAARVLGVEQSTVSRRVAGLEAGLGQRLFERSGAALVLTELGHRILPHAEQLEAHTLAMQELADGQTRGVSGRVRLATTPALAAWVVTPLLAELAAQHEGLMLEVLTGTRTLELGRLEADLALRFMRPPSGELMVRRIASLETCVLVRHDRLQQAEAGQLDWLIADPDLGDSPEGDFLRARLGSAARWKTNDYTLQVEWLRAGLGAAVVPRALMARFPELVEWRLGWPQPPTLELFLATPRSLRGVARVSAVWEALEVGVPRTLDLQF